MRTLPGISIFVILMLALDFYVFQAVKLVSPVQSPRIRLLIFIAYWALSLLAVTGLLVFALTSPDVLGRKARNYIFGLAVGLFLAKLVAAFFLLTDDLRRAIQWVSGKVFPSKPGVATLTAGVEGGISRSTFLSWLGLAAGSTLLGGLVYGFGNRYNYQLRQHTLGFENLPAPFKGMKILQISDIHSGSFMDKKAVERGVDMILQQKPDLILFTGDLVNDRASEMEPYMDIFSRLSAPLGVYSILGNHDYGDYVGWPYNGITKEQNLEHLKEVHRQLGWKLLLNENTAIEKGGHSIAIIGVENWSAKSAFHKRGRMDLAYPGAEKHPFKILMTHDPSHWEAEVQHHYSDIDLILSGHTHGMQFGVELPGFKWSPVQYVYKQWAGLYEQNNQKLYVNRGYGFLGYPGRVGILPEITVLTLS